MKAKIKKFFKINKEDGSNNEEVSLVSILKENNEEGGDSKAQFLEKSENKVDQKYDEVIKELEQKAQLDMLFTEEQLAREQNSNYEEMTIDESYELMGEVIKAPESYNVLSNFFSLLRKVKTSVRSILEKKLRLGLELSKQIKTSLQFTTLSRLISKNQVGGIANLLLRKIEESRKNKVKSMISSGAGVSILVGRSSIRTLQKLTEFDMNVPKGQLGRQITSLPKQILTSLQERLLQNRIDIQTSKKEIEARLERKDMKPGFATTNITGPSTEAYRILPQLLNKTTAALTLQNIIRLDEQKGLDNKKGNDKSQDINLGKLNFVEQYTRMNRGEQNTIVRFNDVSKLISYITTKLLQFGINDNTIGIIAPLMNLQREIQNVREEVQKVEKKVQIPQLMIAR